ncbi:MAG: hypothetical protein J6A07_05135 [Firmicutes bacterium]|nr:hypothetical protein [Bacillota bacterium]
MKRFLALSLSALMLCGALTACGGSTETEAPAPAETSAPAADTAAPAADAAAPAADTASTDGPKASGEGFTFSDLQDNYALLSDLYDKVEAAYMDNSIAQSDEVEANLTEAKDLIDQMGELTEADFADEKDLLEMNDAIYNMCEALGAIVDKMEAAPAEEAPAEEAPAAGSITFEDLQNAYVELVDDYNTIKDAAESGAVTLDDDQTAAMNEAADLINELGELNEADFTSQEDIDSVGASIVSIDEVLSAIAASLS